MRVLKPDFNLDGFFAKLRASKQSVLMLDYDGTLAPFRPERDLAVPYAGVRERLVRLNDLPGTRLVMVSGRWSEDLIPLLGLPKLPEIWGCHGAERVYPDGTIKFVKLKPEAQEGLEMARTWALKSRLEEYLEHKPTSVSFHWRGLKPDLIERVRSQVAERWQTAAAEYGLELRDFDGGLELRVTGTGKGQAVRDILGDSEAGMPVAFLGDDLTDEDAFAALPAESLRVLVRTRERDTRADLWLEPPDDLLAFLDRWLECQV